MFLNRLDRAQYSATHRYFFSSEKQRVWANVYKCAYLRWRDAQNLGDYDTMVMALGLGDQFWERFL
jgi:hypothetical protein